MSEYTPGPWVYQSNNNPSQDDYVVFNPMLSNRHELKTRVVAPKVCGKANARLVAAAPDLLEALISAQKLINEALPKFDWGKSPLDANAIGLLNSVPGIINAAIAKATGETE